MVNAVSRFLAQRIYYLLNQSGFDPLRMFRFFSGIPGFIKGYWQFRKMNQEWRIGTPFPCLADRFESSGVTRGHYFHQDLYVARLVYEANPNRHVDIGSRIDGFVSHLACFRTVEVFDVRKNFSSVENIIFRQKNLMQTSEDYALYCDSLSCLHALEHFGLGRYGDPIDPSGHEKGLKSMLQMLAPGGRFYFSVPIGPERVDFNAHRVFNIQTVLRLCNMLRLINFAYIDDSGELHHVQDLKIVLQETAFGQNYGLGIFTFEKPPC